MNDRKNIVANCMFIAVMIFSVTAYAQKPSRSKKMEQPAQQFLKPYGKVENPTTDFYQPLPAGIAQQSVTFMSEGTKVAGVLYTPKNGKQQNGKWPAVVVNGPASAVKEQASASYARRLAAKGFMVLIFDHRNWGESGGEPRQEHDPQQRVTDIKNAVTYLLSRNDVDSARIGSVGVCVGASYALVASVTDPRIKATATVAGVYGWARTNLEASGIDWLHTYLTTINEKLALQQKTGEVQYLQAVGPAGTKIPLASGSPEAFDYYGNPARSYSPHLENRYTWGSIAKMMSFEAFPFSKYMTTPLLVVHGTNDPWCKPEFAKEIYDNAKGPKEFVSIPNEKHTDFYQGQPIEPAADAVAAWFDKQL